MNDNLQRKRLEKVLISPELPIAEAMSVLDRAGIGILLLVDQERKLLGIVTDGDIRRAMLRDLPLSAQSLSVASRNPLVASPHVTPSEALQLMDRGRQFLVNHLPLVDRHSHIVGLLLRQDLVSTNNLALQAVIMAGGFGARLRPLTDDMPKPMLKVGDRPLLELIIEQLRAAGIQQVNITTHFKPEKITEHFGDGRRFGVNLNYVSETTPLGTAGALGLMQEPENPLLVVNGDILTKVDYRAMLSYHNEHKADLTVGVRQYDLQVPYGVLESSHLLVTRIREKPTYSYSVNAGIYLLQPSVHAYIPHEQRYDMTDLMQQLIADNRRVVTFPIVEYWLDIGQHSDYLRAQEDYTNEKLTTCN
jgi:dTDP-glucose pyrophosphorylase/CBS domain-containing protein